LKVLTDSFDGLTFDGLTFDSCGFDSCRFHSRDGFAPVLQFWNYAQNCPQNCS